MEMTLRAFITATHGMLFGIFFLLAIYGVVVELCRSVYVRQPPELTAKGHALERLYLICMVVLGWAAILSGAYIVYPWYRAIPPAGIANLIQYPQALLKSSPTTAGWHNLGMEWKEHIAWFAPIAMTMVAYVLIRCRRSMKEHPQIRRAVLVFALVAFVSAGVAGFFGAMLNKHAPVRGGSTIQLMGEGR